MNTVDGYAMSSWSRGYGDFVMAPDLDTLMPLPWLPGTALCLVDLQWQDGADVVASPRQVLRRQLARLAERGWTANAGSELEFILFEDSYEQAWDKGYVGLTPANRYNVDYSILGTTRVEPLLRAIRNAMHGAGMRVEDSKGECNLGQHEINFHYSDALTTCDRHVVFKNGAKEIAAQHGQSITFMAKYDEREGNSCHLHLSLADVKSGDNVFATDNDLFDAFLAGAIAGLRELTLLLAPNVNSYKRFAAGSFAPTAVAWGNDNRTCALPRRRPRTRPPLRVPPARRRRQPLPGAGRAHRRGPARRRPAARPATGLRGQRLHRPRRRARPEHAARGSRALRREHDRPRGARRGGRRPLPQHGRCGAGRLRCSGHRLGARPRLRTVVR